MTRAQTSETAIEMTVRPLETQKIKRVNLVAITPIPSTTKPEDFAKSPLLDMDPGSMKSSKAQYDAT